MSKHYTFYTCLTLIVVLMFSIPSLSLAEQHQAENIIATAKYDAERDVNHDINKQTWFTAGMVPVCLVATLTVLSLSSESEAGRLISVLGFIAPLVGPIAAIAAPKPPTERFIGKSPEYISAYTDTYKSKARSIQMTSASLGVATGCGISIAGCIFYLNQSDFLSDFSLGPTF